MAERRIAAIVLPDLLLELALRRQEALRGEAFGVVLLDELSAEETKASVVLDAISPLAASHGVQVGQSIAEAHVLSAALKVVELERGSVGEELGHLAEAALAFGVAVAYETPDTLWVDTSGAAHLVGGEEALALELANLMQELGHRVRVAMASGPKLAQAFARWLPLGKTRGVHVISRSDEARRVKSLPTMALPIATELRAWLVQLGVLTFGQLTELSRAEVTARIGEGATWVLALASGHDPSPLDAYRPAVIPSESTEWDEPVTGTEPLKFVLRGLTARLSARLAGRGESAQSLELCLAYDRSLARLAAVQPYHNIELQLASPLWREEELFRVLTARLERTALAAPCLGLTLSAPSVVRALGRQLDLARVISKTTGAELLPALVAELAQDIGASRVGTLSVEDAHRPEAKTRLNPVFQRKKPRQPRKRRNQQVPLVSVKSVEGYRGEPTRLLPEPVPIDAPLRRGATLGFDQRLYTIEQVRFAERLDSVEWWTGRAVARDYVWLILAGADGVLEALAYVDRATGKRYVQALLD